MRLCVKARHDSDESDSEQPDLSSALSKMIVPEPLLSEMSDSEGHVKTPRSMSSASRAGGGAAGSSAGGGGAKQRPTAKVISKLSESESSSSSEDERRRSKVLPSVKKRTSNQPPISA